MIKFCLFNRHFIRFYCVRSFTMPTKSIPDRWLDYKPVGEAIEKTRFLPFKVPLKQILHETNQLPKEQSFTPSNLFDTLADKNLRLGLLIDLTFTTRYYNNQDITDNDVQYEKIFTAGHHVPNRDVVNRFSEVVKKFEEDNADNDRLIGVHCTHGVNRTGYLICRYMIDHLEFTPDEALKAYEKARGYPVERKNYVEDLQTRPRDDEEEEEPKPEEYNNDRNRRRNNDRIPDHQDQSRPYNRQYSSYDNRRDNNGYNGDRYNGYNNYGRSYHQDSGYGYSNGYGQDYGGRSYNGYDRQQDRQQGWNDQRYSYTRDDYRDTQRREGGPDIGYRDQRYQPRGSRTYDRY